MRRSWWSALIAVATVTVLAFLLARGGDRDSGSVPSVPGTPPLVPAESARASFVKDFEAQRPLPDPEGGRAALEGESALEAYDGKVAARFLEEQDTLVAAPQNCGTGFYDGSVSLAATCDGKTCELAEALLAGQADVEIGRCVASQFPGRRFVCEGCRNGTVRWRWPVRLAFVADPKK